MRFNIVTSDTSRSCKSILMMLISILLTNSILLAQESTQESFKIKTKTGEVTVKAGDEITVETTSGDELAGTVVSVSNQALLLTSKFGEVKIEFENIKEIDIRRKVDDKSTQQSWRHGDPLSHRSYFSATGQTLKKGQKTFENYYLFFNSFNYGITDNVSMNAGMSLFPSDNFIKKNIYMAGLKVKFFDTGNFRIAGGAQYLTMPFVKKFDASFVYPFGVIGFGNPDNHQLNVSYGRLIYIGKSADSDDITSFLNVSAQFRGSNNIKLIAEAMYPLNAEDNDGIPYIYGIRFMTKKLAVDFGFMNSTESGFFPGIPMISFSYTWK